MRRSATWLLLLLVLSVGPAATAEEETKMVVAEGRTIGIEYTLKLDDGSVADTSEGRDPLVYEQGQGQILPALESALEGLEVGGTKEVVLEAEDAYGPVREELFRTVPTESVPEDARKAGTPLMTEDPEGNRVPLRVHEVKGEEIVLDFNHPLAGETLHFDVEVVSIE
jgi:FKBP-type peptidyl-prolyl cis-trans isomerase 2